MKLVCILHSYIVVILFIYFFSVYLHYYYSLFKSSFLYIVM